jgi:hypothetical protein
VRIDGGDDEAEAEQSKADGARERTRLGELRQPAS